MAYLDWPSDWSEKEDVVMNLDQKYTWPSVFLGLSKIAKQGSIIAKWNRTIGSPFERSGVKGPVFYWSDGWLHRNEVLRQNVVCLLALHNIVVHQWLSIVGWNDWTIDT